MADEAKIESTPGPGGPGGSPADNPPPAVQEWFTGLPDTLKGDAAVFEQFKDKPVTDVLAAYRDLSAKAAEYAVPATPAEYGINLPEKLPEGVTLNQAELDGFIAKAHKAGVPAKAMQAIIDQQITDTVAANEEGKRLVAAADKSLRESWGEKYDQNRALVEREISVLPPKTKDAVVKSGMANDPHLMEIFFDLASARSEGKLRAGGDSGATAKSLSERLYSGTP